MLAREETYSARGRIGRLRPRTACGQARAARRQDMPARLVPILHRPRTDASAWPCEDASMARARIVSLLLPLLATATFSEWVAAAEPAGRPAASCTPREGAGACKAACATGSQESCAILGIMHLRGEVDGGADQSIAEHLLRGACKAKIALGCGGLGTLYMSNRNQRRARTLFEKGCTMGDALACESLGGMSLGFDGAKSASRDIRISTRVAVVYYRKACGLGSGAGCVWVAAAIADGAITGTLAEALDLYVKACSLGVGIACRQAVELLTSETPAARALAQSLDVPRLSASLLEHGCKLADAKSCTLLAPPGR